MDFPSIGLLVLDVDGVLTDGRIWASGDTVDRGPVELGGKAFHVQDGFAIRHWHHMGGRSAILSGRHSRLVEARAADLGVHWCRQGVGHKLEVYEQLLSLAGVDRQSVAYVGDDVPDLACMTRSGFPVAVQNALPVVKRHAQYITQRSGGYGAIAEVIEFILRKQGRWQSALGRWL